MKEGVCIQSLRDLYYFIESNFSKQRQRDAIAVSIQDATFSWRLENPINDAQQDNHSTRSDVSSKKLNETEFAAVVEWKLCNVNLIIPAVSQTCMLTFYVYVCMSCVCRCMAIASIHTCRGGL